MKRVLGLLFGLLLCSLPAVAGVTTVHGTIVDPAGSAYANGTIGAALNCNTGQTPVSTPPPVLNYGPGALSGSGAFSIVLTDVATITPTGCSYQFTVCAQSANLGPAAPRIPVCFVSGQVHVTGGSLDIGSTLSALAPFLGPVVPTSSGGCSGLTPAQILFGDAMGNCASTIFTVSLSPNAGGMYALMDGDARTDYSLALGTNVDSTCNWAGISLVGFCADAGGSGTAGEACYISAYWGDTGGPLGPGFRCDDPLVMGATQNLGLYSKNGILLQGPDGSGGFARFSLKENNGFLDLQNYGSTPYSGTATAHYGAVDFGGGNQCAVVGAGANPFVAVACSDGTFSYSTFDVSMLPAAPAGIIALVDDSMGITPGPCVGGGMNTTVAVFDGASMTWNCL